MARRKQKWFKLKKMKKTTGLIWLLVGLIGIQVSVWGFAYVEKNHSQATSQIADAEKRQFVAAILPAAKAQQKRTGLLTSITLAQAILESDWGQSTLAKKYHNLFGVKASGPNSVVMTTQEYTNNTWITVSGRFAVYATDEKAIIAHADLLKNGTTWDKNHYQKVLTTTDYRTAARALQQAGYASDPTYAQKLITLIKRYDLAKYD